MKEFLKSNKFKAFLWTMFNGLVAIGITYMLDTNYIYAPLLVPALNLITKTINTNWNKDYVTKEDSVGQ